MKPELEKQLMEKYPSFFVDMYGHPMLTCLAWGCETGDGWYNLIDEVCQKIKALPNLEPTFRFAQIKEKFGYLRINFSGTEKWDEIYDILNDAEIRSGKICEFCGSTENVTTKGGWIKTLCEGCRSGKVLDVSQPSE